MVGKPVDMSDLAAKWERWIALVTEMHEEFQVHQNQTVALTPLKRPVSQSKVALVSTGGVHLKADPPFDLAAPEGDPTIRRIPRSVNPAELTVSHAHYDTEMALEDVDCIFPIQAARTLESRGIIGELAATHYGLMGFVPNGKRLISETGPELADELQKEAVDVLVMVPG